MPKNSKYKSNQKQDSPKIRTIFTSSILQLKKWLILTAIFLITGAISALLIPYSLRLIINASKYDFALGNETAIFLFLLSVFTALSISTAAREYCARIFCCKLASRLRQKLFEYILLLSPSYMDNTHSGDITSRLNNDINIINDNLFAIISVGLRNFIIAFGCTILMIYSNPLLSLMALCTLSPLAFLASRFGQYSRFLSEDVQHQQSCIQQHILEVINFIRLVKAFHRDKTETEVMHNNNRVYLKSVKRKYQVFCFFIFTAMFSVFTLICVLLWYGAILTRDGSASFGELIQFATYALINAMALSGLADNWNQINELRACCKRLADVFGNSISISNKQSRIVLSPKDFQKIVLKNVCFRYASDKPWALHNISLEVIKGNKLAFVGPSGAGKSTIFRLLLRFYDIQLGRITIDGIDIRDIAIDNLRSFYAYLPQESPMFSRTISENIAYGFEQADSMQISQAAKTANIHSFIETLPHKYQTLLGENALKISVGEKQRLALARTFLSPSPCLLLDEPTGSLDGNNEAMIEKSLDKLITNRTALIIAHRLQSVQNADKIHLIENGRLVHSGNHRELMEKSKLYKDLINKQFTY